MSRVGLREIPLDKSVKCSFDSGSNVLNIKFSDSQMDYALPSCISCEVGESSLALKIGNKSRNEKRLVGLHRSLLNNIFSGAKQKFKEHLVLNGVGYRAELAGKYLTIFIGYTHSIKYKVPEGISVTCGKDGIVLESECKQLLGSIVSDLCKLRRYDPYKGKGLFPKGAEMLRKESNKK